jgi:hypothetical protein
MHCRRGKVPEVLKDLKFVNQFLTGHGLIKNGKIYLDISDRMDTIVFDHETDSLDQYYTAQRGAYVSPSPEFRALVDRVNSNTVVGSRQIFEVVEL